MKGEKGKRKAGEAGPPQTPRSLEGGGGSDAEIEYWLGVGEGEELESLRRAAYEVTTRVLGDVVHYRGLVELSNICTLDCYYCGIRKGNKAVERYTLSREEVVEAALWAADAGYGSCVLQAGERRDPAFVAFIEDCVRTIKERSVSSALPEGLGITLSLGEQDRDTFARWHAAGAHRYLLRIETTNPDLFARLHPPSQRLETRLQALKDLRAVGFQVGTGVMIGLPGQTLADLVADIRFFAREAIDMIGMGPYLPAPGNAMPDAPLLPPDQRLALALKMIAVCRLVLRDVNIAATTALQALVPDGRERGISFGANVTMPSLTPRAVRRNYQLYDGKPCLDEARADCRLCLESRVRSTGRRVGWNTWGDAPAHARRSAMI